MFRLFFFFYYFDKFDGIFFFFVQAEDGIRDATVTGVQTCALPSSRAALTALATMLGMSCHLRSRNTRMPRAVNSLTSDGPSRLNSTGPTFAHRRPGRRAASASASRPLGRSKATISSATTQLAGDAHGHARISE